MDDPQGKNPQATQQYQPGKKKIAPSLPAATLKMYVLIHHHHHITIQEYILF